jgi:hypothetical protein
MRMSFISIVLALGLMVSSNAHAQLRAPASGWTLSDSPTDPFSNVGPATNDTLTIYVWLWCALPEFGGLESAWFFFVPGVQEISDIQLSPGIVDSDPDPHVFDLSLSGCPSGTTLVGQFRSFSYSADFMVCPAAGTIGTGCEIQEPQDLAWIGYSAGTELRCQIGEDFFSEIVGCHPPTSVAPESWGWIKAQHYDP